MSQLLSIVDDKIVIEKLSLKYLDGNTTHVGNMDIKGGLKVVQSAVFDTDLRVRGTLDVDTINVKNLNRGDASQLDAFTFSAEAEAGLDGRGVVWGVGDTHYQLVFKSEPRRIYSSESFDLNKDARYQIDGIDVLLRDSLGNSIKRSKLTEVGTLTGLEVDGNVNLGNVVVVNSYLNRVGVNTEIPNAAFSVMENGIEIVVGTEDNRAIIGTWGNQTLDIITDNTSRINIQGNTVTFGSETSKNAQVKINGTLTVDSIISDVRVERTAPIEFLEDNNSGVYGKGLIWKAKGVSSRQFFLMPNPDRFYSTESIDLASGNYFSIGKNLVINETAIGEGVKNSSLETLGTLSSLTVGGDVNLCDALQVVNSEAVANRSFTIASGDVTLKLNADSVNASDSIRVFVKDTQELAVTDTGITIGNKNNTSRTINAYGKLAVNITHPDPDAAFSVDGPVVMNGKKFVTTDAMPTSGEWSVGDIAWNSTPQTASYIGWVCVASGNPGIWKPFGQIA
jgi:hypothetical protein